MKLRKILAGTIAGAMMIPMMAVNLLAASGDVAINAANFPDANLRDYLSLCFDADANGVLSSAECANVYEIWMSNEDVTTFRGIEYFPNLETLWCSDNDLTSLDVSRNTHLKYLYCRDNKLTTIDLSQNTQLTELDLGWNNLTTIDLSHNSNLLELDLNSNSLTSLNVSNLTNLNRLECSFNNITSLDVSRNTKLTTLECGYNDFSTVDLSHNTLLESITVYGLGLTSFDPSMFPNLHYLDVSSNKLRSIDVSRNSKLNYFRCGDNLLYTINVRNNPNLEFLDCSNIRLARLDVSNNPKLISLECGNNSFSSIDLSHNPLIENLNLANSKISSIDLSNLTHLNILNLSGISLGGLDLSHNPYIEYLYVSDCNLSSLNISNLSELYTLNCEYNNLTSLNIAGNPVLRYLDCSGNNIASLNISNNPRLQASYNGEGRQRGDVLQFYEMESGHLGEDDAWWTASITYDRATQIVTSNVSQGTVVETTSAPENIDWTDSALMFSMRLYWVALGRDYDTTGLYYWRDQLRNGMSGADVAYGFFFSAEVQNSNLTDDQFIERLYGTFMGRESDQAGKADWLNRMANGATREDVFYGFVNSVEWANLCLVYGINSGGLAQPSRDVDPSSDVVAFANRLYTTCLGRDADITGLQDWSYRLANRQVSGSEAARGFFTSAEFVGAGYSNDEYVNRLYLTFLGRPADEAGRVDWVGQLNSGVSREQVFNGFANSQEFAGICNSYGIIR